MKRKMYANIETFEIEESENGSNIITLDGQPISNDFEDEQVCIFD
jgi:hypothetical protein